MNFNDHSDIKGTHSLFSPSQSSWIRYPVEKMVDRYLNQYRVQLGTEIHCFASSQLILRAKVGSIKKLMDDVATYIYAKYEALDKLQYGLTLISNLEIVPRESWETVKMYINDSISYAMTPEQPLYYSDLFYGTADAISFRDNFLRISDLKTGDNPAHLEQLEAYVAIFCLEYKTKPTDISTELRLYQSGETAIVEPDPEKIIFIMNHIQASEREIFKVSKQRRNKL